MAPKIFQASEFREPVKQAIRDGMAMEDIFAQFPVPKSSYFRYRSEVEKEAQDLKNGVVAQAGKSTKPPLSATSGTAGVSKDAFTAQGTPAIPPPGPTGAEYLTVGTFRMPLLDWGYSKTRNLFIVADTFEIAKQEYGFPPNMKVGDFMAELCQAFRIMRGWDVIGVGVYPVKIEKGTEVASDTGRNHGSEVS